MYFTYLWSDRASSQDVAWRHAFLASDWSNRPSWIRRKVCFNWRRRFGLKNSFRAISHKPFELQFSSWCLRISHSDQVWRKMLRPGGATFGKFCNAARSVALRATSLAYGFSTILRGKDLQTTTSNQSVQITVSCERIRAHFWGIVTKPISQYLLYLKR